MPTCFLPVFTKSDRVTKVTKVTKVTGTPVAQPSQ